MLKRIDESKFLSRIIDGLSETVARQRGLPVVAGIALVIVAFVVQLLNVYANNTLLELAGVILQNVGILAALIGMAVSAALGK